MNIAVDTQSKAHGVSGPTLAYRPDIDGLRSLAVLPVLLAHVNLLGFAGGYVGVDVFFVISGYLITSILVSDMASGRYSIAEFYRRRVLRIFPVLFAVLAVCVVAFSFALVPVELMQFARSMGATALFSSNILFYLESDYFDAASHSKPLLHTWSLAIEEQFYIFWPLLLAAIGGTRRRALIWMTAAMVLTSFALSVAGLRWDVSATFYLLPTRAWELGVGALLALVGNPVSRRWANELMGIVGMVLVLGSIWLFDTNTLFPGEAALPTCLGAAMLIASGSHGTLTGRLLSLGPIVFIGQISYSLYMWHWPVIVFTKIAFMWPDRDLAVQIVQIAASLILAILSWRFIEQPFRVGASRFRTPRVLWAGVAAIAIALVVAAGIFATRGMAWRYTPAQQQLASYLAYDGEQPYRRGTCFQSRANQSLDPECFAVRGNRPIMLLMGDSHGAHLWPGLAAENRKYQVVQATMAGCRPMLHEATPTECHKLANTMLTQWAPQHHPAAVLLAGNWRTGDLPALERTLRRPDMRALPIIVIGPIPQYEAALPRLLATAPPGQLETAPYAMRIPEAFDTDRQLRALTTQLGVPYISLIDLFCSEKACRTLAAPGVPMQFDQAHLTAAGSKVVVAALLPRIDAIIARRQAANASEPVAGRR